MTEEASSTVIEMVAEPFPFKFVALIVMLTALPATVGVPEITPVVEFKDKPVGRVPEVTVQFDDAPPLFVGVAEAAAPTSKVSGET